MSFPKRFEFEDKESGIYGLTSRFYINKNTHPLQLTTPMSVSNKEDGFTEYVIKRTVNDSFYLVRFTIGERLTKGTDIPEKIDGEIIEKASYKDLFLDSLGLSSKKERVIGNFEGIKKELELLEVVSDVDEKFLRQISNEDLKKYKEFRENRKKLRI